MGNRDDPRWGFDIFAPLRFPFISYRLWGRKRKGFVLTGLGISTFVTIILIARDTAL